MCGGFLLAFYFKKLPELSKAKGFLFWQPFFFDRDLKEKRLDLLKRS
jgi:hypothetical protein